MIGSYESQPKACLLTPRVCSPPVESMRPTLLTCAPYVPVCTTPQISPPSTLCSASLTAFHLSGWSDCICHYGVVWLDDLADRFLAVSLDFWFVWMLIGGQVYARCRLLRISSASLCARNTRNPTATFLLAVLVLMGQLAPIVGAAPTNPEPSAPTPGVAMGPAEPILIPNHGGVGHRILPKQAPGRDRQQSSAAHGGAPSVMLAWTPHSALDRATTPLPTTPATPFTSTEMTVYGQPGNRTVKLQ